MLMIFIEINDTHNKGKTIYTESAIQTNNITNFYSQVWLCLKCTLHGKRGFGNLLRVLMLGRVLFTFSLCNLVNLLIYINCTTQFWSEQDSPLHLALFCLPFANQTLMKSVTTTSYSSGCLRNIPT